MLSVIIWFSLFCSLSISTTLNITQNSTCSGKSCICADNEDCYIRCVSPGSCIDTRIVCHSRICDVQCTAELSCINTIIMINQTTVSDAQAKLNCKGSGSCQELTLNAVGANATASVFSTLTGNGRAAIKGSQINIQGYAFVNIINTDAGYTLKCEDDEECLSNTYTLDTITNLIHISQRFNQASYRPDVFDITDSIHVNVSCNGDESCLGHYINVEHQKSDYNSSIDVGCHGFSACKQIHVSVTPGDRLTLFCADGDEICLSSTITVSPRFDHTHLVCNGAQGSKSCNQMVIMVPQNPVDMFLHTTFVNEEEDDNLPYAGSIDGVRIMCLNEKLCTEFTPFPLLWPAVADASVANQSFYFYGNYSYNYLFKHIRCRSGKECFIDCKKNYTCSSAFVECDEGSTCHVECNEPYQCDNMVIKAYGDVDLRCGAELACNEATIWMNEKNGLEIDFGKAQSLADLTFYCPLKNLTGRYKVDSKDSAECINECCPTKASKTEPHMTAGTIVAIIAVVIVVALSVGFAVYCVNKRRKAQ
eukprot:187246_1